MKELPILFSPSMVEAILDGRKTMTRRTRGLKEVNEKPDDFYLQSLVLHATGEFTFAPKQSNGAPLIARIIPGYPAYKKGDYIWVRETHKIFCPKDGYWQCNYRDDTSTIVYFKKLTLNLCRKLNRRKTLGKWVSSMFLPKEFARIWLECTSVRCERLQSINGKDAIAEGIMPLNMSAAQLNEQGIKYFDYSKPKQFFTEGLDPFWSFNSLWCSINGGDNWELNPWVFVYEFKRIDKP